MSLLGFDLGIICFRIKKVDWEYYGRDGCDGKITEIYRMPAHLKDGIEKLAAKQRLQKNLSWVDAFDDQGLSNDWITGWFDFEQNKLTEKEVTEIVDGWVTLNVWPGRP